MLFSKNNKWFEKMSNMLIDICKWNTFVLSMAITVLKHFFTERVVVPSDKPLNICLLISLYFVAIYTVIILFMIKFIALNINIEITILIQRFSTEIIGTKQCFPTLYHMAYIIIYEELGASTDCPTYRWGLCSSAPSFTNITTCDF